jgi:hypothetical protein
VKDDFHCANVPRLARIRLDSEICAAKLGRLRALRCQRAIGLLLFEKALAKKIIPGIRMQEKYPGVESLSSCLLVTVNPKHTKKHIDQLVEVISNG